MITLIGLVSILFAQSTAKSLAADAHPVTGKGLGVREALPRVI